MTEFIGILAKLDVESDVPPSGANGHKVILTKRAAMDAIHTLVGKPVNAGHKHRIGTIHTATIENSDLVITGIADVDDPQPCMSFEISNCKVADIRMPVWVIIALGTFDGAAVVSRSKAAYKSTTFRMIR